MRRSLRISMRNKYHERSIIKKTIRDEPNQEDRLTALPDTILVDILSLLPLKYAVATTALSRRWRHHWTQIGSLVIDSLNFEPRNTDFYAIERIISKFTSPFIHCCSIHLRCCDVPTRGSRFCNSMQSLLSQVCDRNVEEIHVKSYNDGAVFLSCFLVPPCIFRTQTLVVLELGLGFRYDEFPRDDDAYNLPNLKKLIIFLEGENRGLMEKLPKCFPSLEELVLDICLGWKGSSVYISNNNLKRLDLNWMNSCETTEVYVDAPELESFVIRSIYTREVNFVTFPVKLNCVTQIQ